MKFPPPVCLQLAWEEGTFTPPPGPIVDYGNGISATIVHCNPDINPGIFEQIEAILSQDVEFVGVNLAYEFGVLYDWLVPEEKRKLLLDRMEKARGCDLQAMLIDIEEGTFQAAHPKGKYPYSMQNLAAKYLQLDLSANKAADSVRMRYAEVFETPLEDWDDDFLQYALDDAVISLKLSKELGEDKPTMQIQQVASYVLAMMGSYGFRIDRPKVDKLAEYVNSKYDEYRAKLTASRIFVNGKKKTAAVAAEITRTCKEHGLEVKYTKTGRVCSDKEVIEQLSAYSEIINDLEELRSVDKLHGTYLPILQAARAYTNYKVLLSTGRTSSFDFNAQNLPRVGDVRECFIADEGMVLVGSDYSFVELCSFSQSALDRFNYSKLADAINAGIDPHSLVAATMLGITYEEAIRRKKAEDKDFMSTRSAAKIALFGYLGGMAPKTLVGHAWKSYRVRITLDIAQQAREAIFATFPECKDHLDWIRNKLRYADTTSVTNRQNRTRGFVGYCEGLNYIFQSHTADGLKIALWNMFRAMSVPGENELLFGCKLFVQVHDEIITQMPEDDLLLQRIGEQERIMVEAMKIITPDVKIAVETDVSRRWSKEAKLQIVDGKVVPWDVPV